MVSARPHGPTVPLVQRQFVLLDFWALRGMREDVEWMVFDALGLQDQSLAAEWAQEGTDSADVAQARVAAVGRSRGR